MKMRGSLRPNLPPSLGQ